MSLTVQQQKLLEQIMMLKDLFLGTIDGKNELITSSEAEENRFLAGFLVPPTVQLDDLLNGQKYFVTGMKGIGKTSLLHYLNIQFKRKFRASTSFFLFKSQFSEEERVTFSRAAGKAQLVSTESKGTEELSFESLWKWFIYKSVVSLVDSGQPSPVVKDADWAKFRACVIAPQGDDERSGIKKLIPKITSGKVLIGASPTVEIDFDWDDKERRTVEFSRLTRQADQLFEKLKPSGIRGVIFFDELELNTTSPERKRRDAELIRDLIIAVEAFNNRSRVSSNGFSLIAAVRSEVLVAIEAVGKEVNKAVADFGVPVIWTRGGVTDLEHPLLDIVIRRIQYSEQARGEAKRESNAETWRRYFPNVIQGKQSPHYVLELTWHRPRDVVRLLNAARTQFPQSHQFNENCLSASKKDYSYQSWVELTEELAARYERPEIEAIRTLLSGQGRYFNSRQLSERIAELRRSYSAIGDISDKYGTNRIISDLYAVGILGNKADIHQGGKPAFKYRYYFKGDYIPILSSDFVVHTALCPFLGIN